MCHSPHMTTTFPVDLSRNELVAICNALNEVLRGPQRIEDWEFHARIGSWRPDVENLHRRLRALV